MTTDTKTVPKKLEKDDGGEGHAAGHEPQTPTETTEDNFDEAPEDLQEKTPTGGLPGVLETARVSRWKQVREWLQEKWDPFLGELDIEDWPVRLLDASAWLDDHLSERIATEYDRKAHIESSIGLTFTVIVPLIGVLGYAAIHLNIHQWHWVSLLAAWGIGISVLLLTMAAYCAGKAWQGNRYGYCTPARELLDRREDLKEAFENHEGREKSWDVTALANDELRDRTVVAKAFTVAVNHRVNNHRGLWLDRARKVLLLGGIIVMLSAGAQIWDTRMREKPPTDSEVEHVERSRQGVRPGVGKPESRLGKTETATGSGRAKAVGRNPKRQRRTETRQERRQRQMTKKKEKQEAQASSGETSKAEASKSSKEKGRPEAKAVPASSVSIQLSKTINSSDDKSKDSGE